MTFKNNSAINATVYFRDDSTLYSNNLTFINNINPKGLNIVGTDHIYAPIIYVNLTHPVHGVIPLEPTTLENAVDNILPNGKIILLSDYTLKNIASINNLKNITLAGNTYNIRKDKYLLILPLNLQNNINIVSIRLYLS